MSHLSEQPYDQAARFDPLAISAVEELLAEGAQLQGMYRPLGDEHLHVVGQLLDEVEVSDGEVGRLRDALRELLADDRPEVMSSLSPASDAATSDSRDERGAKGRTIGSLSPARMVSAFRRAKYTVRDAKGDHVLVRDPQTRKTSLIQMNGGKGGEMSRMHSGTILRQLGINASKFLRF